MSHLCFLKGEWRLNLRAQRCARHWPYRSLDLNGYAPPYLRGDVATGWGLHHGRRPLETGSGRRHTHRGCCHGQRRLRRGAVSTEPGEKLAGKLDTVGRRTRIPGKRAHGITFNIPQPGVARHDPHGNRLSRVRRATVLSAARGKGGVARGLCLA